MHHITCRIYYCKSHLEKVIHIFMFLYNLNNKKNKRENVENLMEKLQMYDGNDICVLCDGVVERIFPYSI